MELDSAIHLTKVFKNQVEDKRFDTSSICISMRTRNGSEISSKVLTPFQAAEYLRFLLKNNHPLFQRGENNFPFGILPEPIVFKGWGRYRNPDNQLEFAVMSVRLRFFHEQNPSELCFDGDFCRTDWDQPLNRSAGPKIHDFIHALEQAGDLWRMVNFTALKDRTPRHNQLRLVPKP